MATHTPSSTTVARALEEAARLLRTGDAREALRLSAHVVAGAPQWAAAQHVHALALSSCGEHAAADAAFGRASELAPRDGEVLLNHAVALRRQARWDEAMQQLRKLVALQPGRAAGWVELGRTALRAGHAAEAVEALDHALRVDPSSALAWHLLGNAQRERGRLDAAEHAFRACIERAPGQWTAWINLGAVLRMAGRPWEALAVYEHVARAGHSGPELLDAWAGALLDAENVDAAIEVARRLTRTHPGYAPGHVTLAHLLWEHDVSETASADWLRRAVQAQPDHAELQAALVRWLIASGLHDEAVAQARALRERVGDPGSAALEADALEAAGRHDESRSLFLSLHAGWGRRQPAFLHAYARHLLRTRDGRAAERIAREALGIDPVSQEAWAYLGTAWRLTGDEREHWLCDTDRLVAVLDVGFPDQARCGQSEIRHVLDRLHGARRAPRQQSVRGGTQTAGRLLQRPDPPLVALRRHLLDAVETWLAALPRDPHHPFLARNSRQVELAGSWSVRLSNGSHSDHIHQEGWISSAFYVALPPSVASGDSVAGSLRFGRPADCLGLDLPPRRIVHPREGRLVLFPSYFWHGTEPFDDDAPRLTVAFDMRPAGTEQAAAPVPEPLESEGSP